MKTIRFAIAQLNPTVGDFSGNTRKILEWIRAAAKKHADLLVFPEISIAGYPVWDLANKKSFMDAGLASLQMIANATCKLDLTVVVGFIQPPAKDGERSRNAMAWIHRGKISHTYQKRLLPTYDVFLEDIFFQPGSQSKVIPWKGFKVGSTICEDIWDNRYSEKPLKDLSRQKANLIVNISASPFYRGVSEVRDQLISKHCSQYGFPMLYVNQVGGQDDLIFDGRSLFCDETGKILFRAPAFQEGLFFYDWTSPSEIFSPRQDPVEEVYQALIVGLRDYCGKNKFSKVLIGLSGGIDSALVATLAVDALGPDAVLGITMPSDYSSEGSWKDSLELAKRLGISCKVFPIKENYKQFLKQYEKLSKKRNSKITLAKENLQARLRGLQLMYISNDESRLLLTTGNKSELAMGYCTLYGDMAGGLAVIGDVLKTDVYQLAKYRNRLKEVIPKPILSKPPSAELRPNQKDQDSLPPYEVLDDILRAYIEDNQAARDIILRLKKKYPKQNLVSLVPKIIRQVDHNEYKRRQTPPILRVTQKAWFGRRMPITNRFEPI